MITYGGKGKKIKIVQALTSSAHFCVSGCLTIHICEISIVCPLKKRAVQFLDVIVE